MSDAPQAELADPENNALLFGEIAIELGLLNKYQVLDALEIQSLQRVKASARTDPESRQPQKIGEIFVERHLLELRSVQKILLIQKRRRGIATPGSINKFGAYEIVSVLGQGGMGLVYKARDPSNDRIIALKVLALRLTDDAEFIARFEREVQTSRELSHPNIVAALGSGTDEGQPYLAMEYIEGTSLGRLLQTNGALSERRALEIARDISAALEHAHSRGVIHRDIKPDNVLLGNDRVVKLTDFGLAKLLRQDQRLTQSGIAIGTPHYISPEQVEASRYIDHRADLYSLGAMLFHMLTGKVPFDGATNNDVMLLHLHEKLRDPRDLNPKISTAATQVVRKLMAKKASERYETAAQVREDLEAVLTSRKLRHAKSLTIEKPLETGRGCVVLLVMVMTSVFVLAKWSIWR
jgi:eukaryotic-like serine/threonine-protein kinase